MGAASNDVPISDLSFTSGEEESSGNVSRVSRTSVRRIFSGRLQGLESSHDKPRFGGVILAFAEKCVDRMKLELSREWFEQPSARRR